MEMKEVEITGVVVWDLDYKSYRFKDYLVEGDFVNGLFKTDYTNLAFVASHQINLKVPANLDLVGAQLKCLDEKEKEIHLQFKQALRNIQIERNNLLAIENAIKE